MVARTPGPIGTDFEIDLLRLELDERLAGS
jgi:hypothetical protein